MNLDDLQQRAVQIRKKYDTLNQRTGNATWSGRDFMAGFVADVGELSEILMAKDGLRKMEDVDTKLAHELSDCLYSILILADTYDIDLASAFMKTMDELTARIDTEKPA